MLTPPSGDWRAGVHAGLLRGDSNPFNSRRHLIPAAVAAARDELVGHFFSLSQERLGELRVVLEEYAEAMRPLKQCVTLTCWRTVPRQRHYCDHCRESRRAERLQKKETTR